MAAPTNYDQTNEWLAEVDRRVQDLINILKGGIDVGQSGTLGNLALIDTLSDSPIGNLSALQQSLQVDAVAGRGVVGSAGDLMAEGAFGIGTNLPDSIGDYNTLLPTGFYGDSSLSTPNQPMARRFTVLNINRTAASIAQKAIAIDSGFSEPREFTRVRDGNGWHPWRENYHQGSILGTVSQSGGMPTGAIIERGSNANGEYFKYAGGMLICETELFVSDWETASFGASSYPAAFSSPPSVAGSVQDGGVIGFANSRSAKVVGRGSSWAYDIDGTGVNGNVYQNTLTLTAIGHWD